MVCFHTVARIATAGLMLVATPLVVTPLAAQGGRGMAGMSGGMMAGGDTATTAIMRVVHELMTNHDKLRRTVTNLPMSTPSLHGVLRNGASITRTTKETAKGVLVTETSKDPATIALMQAHAAEVTDLVNRGMAATHESMMKNGGMMDGMMGGGMTPAFVHMQSVPGANVMAAKRAAIRYTFTALPRGGQLLIVSKDKDAITAIHEFLAFQRMDHRTP